MTCDDWTPYSINDYPYSINLLHITAGSNTNQTTGEWIPETTTSSGICGYFGSTTGGKIDKRVDIEGIKILSGGKFKTGDQFFACHEDCNVLINDILEVYNDLTGTTKNFWKIISKVKQMHGVKKLTPFERSYYLVRLEVR